jgi:hypothetical protein
MSSRVTKQVTCTILTAFNNNIIMLDNIWKYIIYFK